MQDRICIFRFFVLFLHPLLKSCRDGGIGRHEGLKILWPETAVWVQVPLAVQRTMQNGRHRLFFMHKGVISSVFFLTFAPTKINHINHHNIMRRLFFSFSFLFLFVWVSWSSPKREFRATWFTTHYAIDWPKTRITNGTQEQINRQKKEMTDILDSLLAGNLNAACMQVRPLSDAYYKSSYEPWGVNLTGVRGKDPGYDPLAFAVRECHARGMELHAWVNPFRYEVTAGEYEKAVNNGTATADADAVRKSHPDWLLTYNNGTFKGTILDPGHPEARAYVVKVLMEIVNNYDIDGILMDDYFYAYGGTTTEDEASVKKYKPDDISLADWRRENVNKVISSLYDSIQQVKPWVKLGMGPGGIYSMDKSAAEKYGLSLPEGIRGGDPYTSLYCDPLAWVNGGYVDYLAPQIYWGTMTTTTDYDVLSAWWGHAVHTLCDRRDDGKRVHQYVSQASYRYGADELGLEVDDNRLFAPYEAPGSVFYNTNTYLSFNGERTCHKMSLGRFAKKALPPVVSWKQAQTLSKPEGLQLTGRLLTWSHASAPRFSVYAYPVGMDRTKALEQADYLLGMTYEKDFVIEESVDLQHKTIAVCAMDRYGNEYEPALLNEGEVKPVYTITLAVKSGKGVVRFADSELTSGQFMEGEMVVAVATPAYGYDFAGWSDGNRSNPREIEVRSDMTYEAVFAVKQGSEAMAGELSRELLWEMTAEQSGFMGTNNEQRSIAYKDDKVYVSNGIDYAYHELDAQTGELIRTVSLPSQYHVWHNLRITDDGVMMSGNTATTARSLSVYELANGQSSIMSSFQIPDFGRSDYFYPIGTLSDGGYMMMLSNVSHKALYIPFADGGLGEPREMYHSDLPAGTSAKAIPLDAESFVASVSGRPATLHSLTDGSMLDDWQNRTAPPKVNVSGVGLFSLAGHKYLLVPNDVYGSFLTYDITEGLSGARLLFADTPALGANDNKAFTIDFAFAYTAFEGDIPMEVTTFVLAPNNGVAAYKYKFEKDYTDVSKIDQQTELTVWAEGDQLVVRSLTRLPVRIYTAAGALVCEEKAESDDRLYRIVLPHGVYIVQSGQVSKVCVL